MGVTTRGTVLKSHHIREVEQHWSKVKESTTTPAHGSTDSNNHVAATGQGTKAQVSEANCLDSKRGQDQKGWLRAFSQFLFPSRDLALATETVTTEVSEGSSSNELSLFPEVGK